MVGLADHTPKLMCYAVNNLLLFLHWTSDLFGVLYLDFPSV